MKTFRLIGMALLAVVMCVNLASCSSDDDEEETSSEYKLLLGTWERSGYDTSNGGFNWSDTYSFKSNNTYSYRHTEANETDDYSGKFTYDADTHKITCYEGNSNIVDEEYFIAEVNSTTLKLRDWSDSNDDIEIYTRK